jgi:CubicO group peptidase (beta-lactamase class C family)
MRHASVPPLVAGVLVLGAVVAAPTHASDAVDRGEPPGEIGGPPTVTGADLVFKHPDRTLRDGSAQDAGLVEEHVERIVLHLTAYLEPGPDRPNPSFAGAVVIAGHRGVVVEHAAMGHALRYAAYADGEPTELQPDEWVPMREDTIFDMASITKLFTVVATIQQVEAGLIDFDAAVADYIPEFGQNGKDEIRVAQLLSHTSGLRSWAPLYSQYPTPEERIAAVYAEELAYPPGTEHVYSDLNLITLGKVIEEVTGERLDDVVRAGITEPLGMADTGFNPPTDDLDRFAATEDMSAIGRGMVRGEVHDENAWSLDGVSGHAGIFSTARDMATFAQMLLNGGRYGSERIIREESVREIFTNENAHLPPAAARGRGFQLNQRFYMDALSSPVTAGHTGFTGTSIVIDPLSESFVVLLSNRVHPTRDWGASSEYRRPAARDLARAIPVHPAVGRDAWYSGQLVLDTVTLTAPLDRATSGGRVSFRLWYDTTTIEDDGTIGPDVGSLLASTDGGATWAAVPIDLRVGRHRWSTEGTFAGFSGRQWLTAEGRLPDGTTHVRWEYQTRPDTTLPEPDYHGRGVYVDGVRIVDRGGLLWNGERPADADRFIADGWHRSAD